MRFVSNGLDAKVVMAGVGSAARQAWPPVAPRNVSVSFATQAEFEKLSVHRFDVRTDSASMLVPSIISGNRLVPRPNVAPTYEYRVIDQLLDGALLTIETVVGSSPKSLDYPSMVILSAGDTLPNDIIGVEYGSNGVRILSLLGTSVRHESFTPYTIISGSILRVERFLTTIQIYVNGVRIAKDSHSTYANVGAPGVGLFSLTGTNVSTSIGPTTIIGSSSIARTFGGTAYFEKMALERSVYTPIASMHIAGGRMMRSVLVNARWATTTSFSSRAFGIYLNGTRIGLMGDQNGTAIFTSAPFNVPANSIVEVQAASDTESQQGRTIASGYFNMIPA